MFLKRIQYNAPVVLTFTLVSLIVVSLKHVFGNTLDLLLFCVYRSPATDPLTYVRLIGHIFGHADFSHYFNNFLLILLIGPILEEKYGSKQMLIMMLITSVVTGGIFVLITSNTALQGASGIVFMMILLSSFVNLKSGKIPVTLILVVVAYIGRETIYEFTATDNISHLTHVIGGLCGAVLGFIMNKKKFLNPTFG
jgi:membrane associated rhomboid family serine protease